MRKLETHHENPIDDAILHIGDKVIPWLKKSGHTPNTLTAYSFIFGLLSVWYLKKGEIRMFAVYYAISYIWDCLDGHMARKYNMTSKFGDYFDHITDYTVHGLVAYFVFKMYSNVITKWHILIFCIMTFLMSKHMGCQQENNKVPIEETETLDILKRMCPQKTDISWTRYFGAGTFNLFIILFVFYIDRVSNSKI